MADSKMHIMSEINTLNVKVDQDTSVIVQVNLQHKDAKHAAKTVCLEDLIPDYIGPHVNLDFDENNRLIGIEVIK